jgi:hypothetical protein
MTTYFVITAILAWIGYLLGQPHQISDAFAIAAGAIIPLFQPNDDGSTSSSLSRLLDALREINKNIIRQPFFHVCLATLAVGVIITGNQQFQSRPIPKALDYTTYIIDNSGSMGLNRELINHKTKVEHAVEHIRSHVNQLTDYGQLGLIVIGGVSGESLAGECKITPLINDRASQAQLLEMLGQIEPNASGATDISGAIAMAVHNISKHESDNQRKGSSKQIIVISDLGHNCASSAGLETINAQVSQALNSGYESAKNQPIRTADTREYIQSIVVFSLRAKSAIPSALTSMSDLFLQQAQAHPTDGLSLNTSDATGGHSAYNRDLRLLRQQGIIVKELSLEELGESGDLTIPSREIMRVHSAFLLSFLFWSSYLVSRLILIAATPAVQTSPAGFGRRTNHNSTKDLQGKVRHLVSKLRTAGSGPEGPGKSASTRLPRSDADHRTPTDLQDSSIDSTLGRAGRSDQSESIDILLTWNSSYQEFLRFHVLWREYSTADWIRLHNSLQQQDVDIETFTISRLEYNEQGGPICLRIQGLLNGCFWIIVENFYQTHPVDLLNAATPLEQLDAHVEVQRDSAGSGKQKPVHYYFTSANNQENIDPTLGCWDVCSIDCTQTKARLVQGTGVVAMPKVSDHHFINPMEQTQ